MAASHSRGAFAAGIHRQERNLHLRVSTSSSAHSSLFSNDSTFSGRLLAVAAVKKSPNGMIDDHEKKLCAFSSLAAEADGEVLGASGTAAAAAAVPLPALAGEPPSVGIHWYWDLGIGTLHGETASIVMMVVFVTVVFALLGAGGSTRKA